MLEVVDCDQGSDSRTGSDTRMLGTVYLRDEDHRETGSLTETTGTDVSNVHGISRPFLLG